jgi:hypothetical protein
MIYLLSIATTVSATILVTLQYLGSHGWGEGLPSGRHTLSIHVFSGRVKGFWWHIEGVLLTSFLLVGVGFPWRPVVP